MIVSLSTMENESMFIFYVTRLSFSDHRNILKSGHGQQVIDNAERLFFPLFLP